MHAGGSPHRELGELTDEKFNLICWHVYFRRRRRISTRFEQQLLRLKCEAYSTFNDSDENTDTERRWQSKVVGSGVPPHNMQFIAPAALYLTAIIECVYAAPCYKYP